MAIQTDELTKDYQYGFHDVDVSVFRTAKGSSPEVVAAISQHKGEPEWMRRVPAQGAATISASGRCPPGARDLSGIDFDNIYYYVRPSRSRAGRWDDVPDVDQAAPSTASASPRPSASSWPASAPSTTPRSSTTASRRTSRSRA